MNRHEQDRLLELSSSSLRDLLLLGAEGPGFASDIERQDECLCQAVEALLAEPIPILLPDQAAQTIGDCLFDRNQSTSVFVRMKDYFKNGTATWQADLQAEAARVLYFAALAAAVVFRGENISSLPAGQRAQALEYLAGRMWMPRPLAELFTQALQAPADGASPEPAGD